MQRLKTALMQIVLDIDISTIPEGSLAEVPLLQNLFANYLSY